MFAGVNRMLGEFVLKHIDDVDRLRPQPLSTSKCIDRDVEAIDLIHNDHIEWRCGCSFADISTHMKTIIARSALNNAPDCKAITMVDENYRNFSGEVIFKLDVIHAVR